MSMNSRAIAQRSIARQDAAPQDTSLLWLDTSFDPAKLKQYNGSTAAWESVASSVVSKQDTAPTAPSDGDLWQDTSVSPSALKAYETDTGEWEPINRRESGPLPGSGDTTISADTTLSGLQIADTWTLEAGTTLTVGGDGYIFVRASERINVAGTIDAIGAGGAGGAGGNSNANGGGNGENAAYTPQSTGGSGGLGDDKGWSVDGGDGGDGGDGDADQSQIEALRSWVIDELRDHLTNGVTPGAGGGGGGASGVVTNDPPGSGRPGGSGSAPGGGAGGGLKKNVSSTSEYNPGGDGGNGGGMVVLEAPTVSITGSVLADGEDGEGGVDDGYNSSGSGGGGSGGVIVVLSGVLDDGDGTLSVSKGLGGSTPGSAPPGGDGEDGIVIRV